MLSSSNKILADTKKIASAKIAEFDTKIKEKEILLSETLNNFDIKISRTEDFIYS